MDYRPYDVKFALADARANVHLASGEVHVFPSRQGALMIAPTSPFSVKPQSTILHAAKKR